MLAVKTYQVYAARVACYSVVVTQLHCKQAAWLLDQSALHMLHVTCQTSNGRPVGFSFQKAF